jgi:hypothetical protein
MKFLKFLSWSVIGLALLSGLTYWLLPTLGSMLITQGLTNRGFTNVVVNLDHPGSHALTIPSLAFTIPLESGSTSIIHVEISNPLAPQALQQISINISMDALQERYEGTIHLEGDDLLLNLLTFSLTHNGSVSFTGTHTNTPEDPVLDLKTSLDRSPTALKLQGKTTVKLHPLIHTLAALYPLPPEYQSLTGTFSGSWTGTIHEQASQATSSLSPIQGNFALDAHIFVLKEHLPWKVPTSQSSYSPHPLDVSISP